MMNRDDSFVSEAIKQAVQREIAVKLEEEIIDKVNQFHRELIDRKDNYIAEIMKGIRIYAEEKTIDMIPRYKIEFENIYRVEQ